jgi:hypothetical protein
MLPYPFSPPSSALPATHHSLRRNTTRTVQLQDSNETERTTRDNATTRTIKLHLWTL